MHKMPFGKRATVYSGVANLREIIHAEVAAKRRGNAGPGHGSEGSKMTIEELESGRLGRGNGKMLVTGEFNDQLWFSVNLVEVSASEKIRDDLRIIVRSYLNEKVRLLELDYQPRKK